jgi:nucleotide-binding universal stress UspA family protein
MTRFRTILHPTDFSASSQTAFDLACSLAKDHGARLVLLHVAAPAPVVVGDGVLAPAVMPAEFLRDEEEQLRGLRPAQQGVPVEHVFVVGDVTKEILNVARDARADFIVMGTHGRTGLRRMLLGSVAEEIIRRAPCPVLAVKLPAAGGVGGPSEVSPKVARIDGGCR